MHIIPEIDIKKKVPEINKKGFLKSMRKSDTGIGFTFEYHMGIKENNLRNHDFTYNGKLSEAKSQRINSKSMLTLFTKEPSVRNLKDIQLMKKYGYIDGKGRLALKDSCVYNQFNQRDLSLKVDMKNKSISIIDGKGDTVWEWLPDDIDLKFKNLLLVFAENKHEHDSEWFHYVKADYLENFIETKFLELIKNKKIVVDLRMHQNKMGNSRNHGTAFRIRDLNELRDCYTKTTKIL